MNGEKNFSPPEISWSNTCVSISLIDEIKRDIFHQELTLISQFTPSQTAEAVENLHALSQILHVVRGNVTDLQELLQYLVGVHKRLMAHSGDRYDPLDIESVEDSFAYLKSKSDTLKVWIANYAERTGIRINLFLNLAAQSDSRTNLEIARLTSKIAVSTQRDSTSMITCVAIACLSLVLLTVIDIGWQP